MLCVVNVLVWAHPRVSGENYGEKLYPGGFWGSSPRERGKPDASSLPCR